MHSFTGNHQPDNFIAVQDAVVLSRPKEENS